MSVFDSFPDHLDEENPAPHFLRDMDWAIAVDYVNNKQTLEDLSKQYPPLSRERVRQILVKVVDAVWGQQGRCATCRWWQVENNNVIVSWAGQAGICRLTTDERGLPPTRAEAACINEGISGELYTARDFGCIQWQAKREKQR